MFRPQSWQRYTTYHGSEKFGENLNAAGMVKEGVETGSVLVWKKNQAHSDTQRLFLQFLRNAL